VGAPRNDAKASPHRGDRAAPTHDDHRSSLHHVASAARSTRGPSALPDAQEEQHKVVGMLEAESASATEARAQVQLQGILAGSSGLWSSPRVLDAWEQDFVSDDDDVAPVNEAAPSSTAKRVQALSQHFQNITKEDGEWRVNLDRGYDDEDDFDRGYDDEDKAVEEANAEVPSSLDLVATHNVQKVQSSHAEDEDTIAELRDKVKEMAKDFSRKQAAAENAEKPLIAARTREAELLEKKDKLGKEAEETLAAARSATEKVSQAYEQALHDLEQQQSQVQALRKAHLDRRLEAREAKEALVKALAEVKEQHTRSKLTQDRLRAAQKRLNMLTGRNTGGERNGASAAWVGQQLLLVVGAYQTSCIGVWT